MTKSFITFGGLFIGAFIQGIGMAIFLFPNAIPSGGAAGLAILLYHLLHIPLGTGLWAANFIFLTMALKYFGFAWTVRTMFSVTITSVTVTLLGAYAVIPTTALWIDIISGSILFGIGVGLLIKNGASSGGMVIPALMIASLRNWRPGRVMFWINLSIFLTTALVIDLKIVFFAILCQYISTTIIDLMQIIKLPYLTIPSFAWRKKQ